ncbi:response regulator [Lyngbya aestuarii]|uniref:response regulator n=1 Tax=Lyngbya aestuarii TaxID=118322 RepID=UPI00403DF45F
MPVQIPDGLTLDSNLADLPSHDFQVSLTTSGNVVAQAFQKHPELPGVILTANYQVVGMISRTKFLEWLSRPYGLEIFLRRPIQSLWRMIALAEKIPDAKTFFAKYLVLSATCSIDKAVELALQRPVSVAYEPIVIEWRDGQRRLVDMQVLLLAQSQLFATAKKAADAANTAKSEFLANMSHELRTPLNAILGFTQVITRDSKLSREQKQNLEIITHSSEYLLELINDILQMSKIEAGRSTVKNSDFDLYRLLENLQEMLQLKALSKGLQLIFECDANLPQYMHADEGKLREILTNILSNGIKFTQEGSVILRVKVEPKKPKDVSIANTPYPITHRLYFEVEDTGPGIACEEIHKLFTAFGQTQTGQNSQQGTGLGLAISKKFVQLMEGDIRVSSVLGQGTKFTFNIPITIAETTKSQIKKESRQVIELAPDQPEYRILAVDDSPDNRLLLTKLLTSVGFCVASAENGQQAVELWSNYSPHLIFMDMRMPVMDGYEATRRIKAHPQGQATVIIALTASAFEENRSTVLSAGCDDFLRKPFRQEELWEKIAQHLGVRYLYENLVVEDKNYLSDAGSIEVAQSLNAHLSGMPREWVKEVNEAALKCLDHKILRLCEQIPEVHAPLANALRNWANNFLFDQVIELIRQAQITA